MTTTARTPVTTTEPGADDGPTNPETGPDVTSAEGRSRLGRRLQLVRGLYWGWGSNGDALTTLLSGSPGPGSPDPDVLGQAVSRSRTGAWVVARPDVARTTLVDPSLRRVESSVPEWARAADTPARLWSRPFQQLVETATAPAADDDAEERVAATVAGRSGRLDLVRDLAWPAALAALDLGRGAGDGGPGEGAGAAWDLRVALDAQLAPQDLATTAAALTALTTLTDVDAGRVLAAALLAGLLSEAVLAAPADGIDPAAHVDRTLRLAPTRRLERRAAVAATTIAGQEIAAGEEVVVVLGAADGDPAAPARSGAVPTADLGLDEGLDDVVRDLAGRVLPTVLAAGVEVVGPAVRRPRSPVLHALAECPVDREER